MYSEACEAQGMTLADLIKKQDEDKGIIYPWVTLEWSALTPDNVLRAQGRSGKGIFVRIHNDTGSQIRVCTWSGSTQIGTQIMSANSTEAIASGYPGCTVRNAEGDILLEVIDAVERTLYTDFGLSHVELPDDCTNVKAMWDDVCTRVNEKYWKRYLACETLEEWQVELQVLTDAVARRYERALRLYDANADAIEKEFGAKQVTEYGDLKDTSSQTKNATSNTTVSATPDQSINDSESYAGTTSNGSSNAGTTEHTRTGKITVTQVGGDSMLGAINDNVAKWHDIETELVDEYAHVFMSYIWS